MRKATSSAIKSAVKRECAGGKVPFTKSLYRRAKKEYNKIPWNIRHKLTWH